jgi:hypothetical protein
MTVISGNFRLTPEQVRFKEMIEPYSKLAEYWDFEKRECDQEGIENALTVLSHSKAVLLRFFVAIWMGENVHNFDLIDAVKALDTERRKVILTWFENPFFP